MRFSITIIAAASMASSAAAAPFLMNLILPTAGRDCQPWYGKEGSYACRGRDMFNCDGSKKWVLTSTCGEGTKCEKSASGGVNCVVD
ncbi:hypothetical protein PspLS_10006 [Pyricularia sp. CBS 133598]|nr:hypothetical protein PspLS_10006 [Pyricularia sp. CBS 133598]